MSVIEYDVSAQNWAVDAREFYFYVQVRRALPAIDDKHRVAHEFSRGIARFYILPNEC